MKKYFSEQEEGKTNGKNFGAGDAFRSLTVNYFGLVFAKYLGQPLECTLAFSHCAVGFHYSSSLNKLLCFVRGDCSLWWSLHDVAVSESQGGAVMKTRLLCNQKHFVVIHPSWTCYVADSLGWLKWRCSKNKIYFDAVCHSPSSYIHRHLRLQIYSGRRQQIGHNKYFH